MKITVDIYCLSTALETAEGKPYLQSRKLTLLVRDAPQRKGNMGKNEDKD